MERGRGFVVSDGKAVIVKVVVITGKKRRAKMVVLDGNCDLLTRLMVEEGVWENRDEVACSWNENNSDLSLIDCSSCKRMLRIQELGHLTVI